MFVDVPGFNTRLRTDRAYVMLHLPHLDVTGARLITFGSTFFFTPMDVVAPFSPLIVDREYKPGVDALRADVYIGHVHHAHGGGGVHRCVERGGHGGGGARRHHVGDSRDVGVFGGVVRGDSVVGADVSGGVAGLGVRGEATLTVPRRVEDTFLRAALGLDKRFERAVAER